MEIKAKCGNPQRIRKILQENGADFTGSDHQIDTYFNCRHGRLKLREGNIENSLIHYIRPDISGPGRSDVILYRNEPGSELKHILKTALGVLTVVDKKREIYFIENVKFHIDQVESLGSFAEIEAIDREGNLGVEYLKKQCCHYMSLFDILEEDLIDRSYSDMILEKMGISKSVDGGQPQEAQ